MSDKKYHILFEGAELTGKSYLISRVYDILEKKYSSKEYPHLLDGCFWLNCDIGAFGLPEGKAVIETYVQLAEKLKNFNLIFEKFHISDQVYSLLYRRVELTYPEVEKKLKELGFRIVFLTINADQELFAKRLDERIKLYDHYKRIAQTPEQYIKQQKTFERFIDKTILPVLPIDTTNLPDEKIIKQIITWLQKN